MEVMGIFFPCLSTSLMVMLPGWSPNLYNHTTSPKIVLELPDTSSLQFSDVLSHDCYTASDK